MYFIVEKCKKMLTVSVILIVKLYKIFVIKFIKLEILNKGGT